MGNTIQIINMNQPNGAILTKAEVEQLETDVQLTISAEDVNELLNALKLAGHQKTEMDIHCRINQEPLERFFVVKIMYNFESEVVTWFISEEFPNVELYLKSLI